MTKHDKGALTRRQFLSGAFAVGTAALSAGCGFYDIAESDAISYRHPSWTAPAREMPLLDIRAASYNIAHYRGRDDVQDPHRTASVLAGLEADIVGLQETDNGPDHVTGMSRLELLADRSGLQVVELPTDPPALRFHRNSILSRYPVREVRLRDVSVSGRDPRGIIDAEIETDDGIVRLVNTHFGLNGDERRYQIEQLIDVIYSHPRYHGVIVMGDFNEWFTKSANFQLLERYLGESHGPLTYPSGRPVFQLDRIWTKPINRQTDIHVPTHKLARMASDHLPICARITF